MTRKNNDPPPPSPSGDISPGLKAFLNAAATYVLPPVTLYRFAKLFLGTDPTPRDAGFHPERRDPEFISQALPLVMAAARAYFRLHIEGVQNVPQKGAVLMVGNHNGGLQPVDTFITAGAVVESQGPERPVYGLGHDILFREPSLGNFIERMGALRAHPDAARMVLESGGVILVYPGGDIDAFRPFAERNRICLGGRKGFIRTALRTKSPIVPVVSVGAHEAFVVLSRGERMAAALNLKKRLRTEVCPIAFSLPLGITSAFMPYIPLPTKMDIRFLPPMKWKKLKPKHADDESAVEDCYLEVVAAMQAAMDEMHATRKWPVIG